MSITERFKKFIERIGMKKYVTKIKRFFQFENRTFDDYSEFIKKALNNGFEFVPLKDFQKQRLENEKIIGYRHDVDSELDHALKIAKIEHDLGVRSTYYVLHTAKYFYKNVSKDILNDSLIEKLLYLQNTLGHEVGLHIDLMPIEVIFKKDPVEYTKNLIQFLKENGINIVGVAPHGNLFHDVYRKKYKIENKEFINNIFADPYINFNTGMFNVDYEAYSLEHDNYLSDASFIENKRWDFSRVEEDFFKKTGRTIVLTHTIHWAPSNIYYFTVNFWITVEYFLKYLSEYIKLRKTL